MKWIAICAMAIALSHCSGPKEVIDPEPVDPPDWSGKNCLVVVLDALTVNHLAMWGYDRETTPNIDRLASRGVVFKFARSQASSTPPSAYSYFTGQYPPLLLLEKAMHIVQLPAEKETFAEAFKNAGYDTGAFSGNLFVSSKAGFDQGFDAFDMILRHLPLSSGKIELDEDSTTKLIESAKDWIQSREDNPWLCYLHILRPHNPYRAPDPLGSAFAGDYDGPVDGSDAYWESVEWYPKRKHIPHLKDYYDGNLLYVDSMLGELFDTLEQSGDLEDTAIIVVSDHGEAFMEHGHVLHNTTVHEELIRVPFIVVPPKNGNVTPKTITQPIQLVDLFPTMAELFDLQLPPDRDGVSLASALNGGSVEIRPMFAQDGNGDLMCIIEDGRKLVLGYDRANSSFIPIALYYLTRDPGETRNHTEELPLPVSIDMYERALEYTNSHTQNEASIGENLVEYEREILETLGYL
jgi:arylsulfatase A-like enzyme